MIFIAQHFSKGRIAMALLLLASCIDAPKDTSNQSSEQEKVAVNPVFHFEIPVADMERAIAFYTAVFDLRLSRQMIDGYDMAFFPRTDDAPGASGALAKGDVYVPGKTGAILYFDVPDIDAVLTRATAQKGKILYPKKHIGEAGYVAEIEDSEGNRIGLTAANG
jgi:uncharacterized protein